MERSRYSSVAIALHWAVALLIVANLSLAFTFDGYLQSADPADKRTGFELIQTHKAIGLTVLALSVVRLLWRLTHPAPPLPAAMPGWQKFLAYLTHWGLYALMIGVPLLGWAMSSASPIQFPIQWFGLFEWPKLPMTPDKALADGLSTLHGSGGLLMAGLAMLHVLGALKHWLMDDDRVIERMIPVRTAK